MTTVKQLIETIGNKPTFVALNYTTKENEVQRCTILLNASYSRMRDKDKKKLINKLPKLEGIEAKVCSDMIIKMAENESDSTRTNQSKAQLDTYYNISKNIKVHRVTGEIYLNAVLIKKTVIKEGNPKKVVNSKPETIIKNKLSKDLKTSKVRQYTLQGIEEIRVNKRTIKGIDIIEIF